MQPAPLPPVGDTSARLNGLEAVRTRNADHLSATSARPALAGVLVRHVGRDAAMGTSEVMGMGQPRSWMGRRGEMPSGYRNIPPIVMRHREHRNGRSVIQLCGRLVTVDRRQCFENLGIQRIEKGIGPIRPRSPRWLRPDGSSKSRNPDAASAIRSELRRNRTLSASMSRGSIQWMPESATSTTMIVFESRPQCRPTVRPVGPSEIACGPTSIT